MTQPTCQHCGKPESEHYHDPQWCVYKADSTNPLVNCRFTPTQSNDAPSPTPRTDTAKRKQESVGVVGTKVYRVKEGVVTSDFARTLERELTALATELAESRAAYAGCDSALSSVHAELAATKERLQIDPGGSDKIDELESVLNTVRSERDSARAEVAALRERLARLDKAIAAANYYTMPEVDRGPASPEWVEMRKLMDACISESMTAAPEKSEPSGDAAKSEHLESDSISGSHGFDDVVERRFACELEQRLKNALATAQATIAQLTKERDEGKLALAATQGIFGQISKNLEDRNRKFRKALWKFGVDEVDLRGPEPDEEPTSITLRAERDTALSQLAEVTRQRDEASDTLKKLLTAVKTFQLAGVPDINTVDDVVTGMRTIAKKFGDVAFKSENDSLRTQLDTQARHIAGMREALQSLERDYDHAWPNEDAATTDHRQYTLRIIRTVRSPDSDNGWVKREIAQGLFDALTSALSDADNGMPANPQVAGDAMHIECQNILIEGGWEEDARTALTRAETALAGGREG